RGNCYRQPASLTASSEGYLQRRSVGTVRAVRAGTKGAHGTGNRIKAAAASDAHTAGSASAEASPDVGAGVRAGDGRGARGQSVPGRKPRRAARAAARRRGDRGRRGRAAGNF